MSGSYSGTASYPNGEGLRDPTPDEVEELLVDLYEDGDLRDSAGGGISTEVLADHYEKGTSAILDRLHRLRAAGRVERVRGVDLRRKQPRLSWVPTVCIDDEGDVDQSRRLFGTADR